MLSITLLDGRCLTFDNTPTPYDVCCKISSSLSKAALLAQVNGISWDLHRPIPYDAKVRILTQKDDDILPHLRHSLAHIMAQAVQSLYRDTQVAFGPAIDNGFYYDFWCETPFTPDDLVAIEEKMHQIIADDLPFKREELSRDAAEALFLDRGETLKAEHVRVIPADQALTIYRQGDWLDLCRGPHLPSTAKAGKAFKLTSVAGAYWRGDVSQPQLQRIYATAWRTQEELSRYEEYRKEVEKRDHRILGRQLDLFHLQEEAAGSVFWHPKGWVLYRLVESFVRTCLDHSGYQEVRTPQLVNRKLWELSGHWEKFGENNMFVVDERKTDEKGVASTRSQQTSADSSTHDNVVKTPQSATAQSETIQPPSDNVENSVMEQNNQTVISTDAEIDKPISGVSSAHTSGNSGVIHALKPMNCPCHVEIFRTMACSYKQLPLRMAEFGSCHRNEPSGSLHGIMRVRAFTQDDAHIFCTPEQINQETIEFCRLLSAIYRSFGFEQFSVKFSDRPDVRAGSDEVWDKAEAALRDATTKAGVVFEDNHGEGAFYGPKLEFILHDAIGRAWQCGTLQVDFILAQRLNAHYIDERGVKKHPVLLHRAILGSFERFIGILIENYEGKFPLWLSPVQLVIATVTNATDDYGQRIAEQAKSAGLRVELDTRSEKIGYKIRQHSLAKVPLIWVVGERDRAANTVDVRALGTRHTENISVDQALKDIKEHSAPPPPYIPSSDC